MRFLWFCPDLKLFTWNWILAVVPGRNLRLAACELNTGWSSIDFFRAGFVFHFVTDIHRGCKNLTNKHAQFCMCSPPHPPFWVVGSPEAESEHTHPGQTLEREAHPFPPVLIIVILFKLWYWHRRSWHIMSQKMVGCTTFPHENMLELTDTNAVNISHSDLNYILIVNKQLAIRTSGQLPRRAPSNHSHQWDDKPPTASWCRMAEVGSLSARAKMALKFSSSAYFSFSGQMRRFCT